MKNNRIFEVYYLPATGKRGVRLKINDLRHGQSITISVRYDDKTADYDAKDLAAEILTEWGIPITGYGQGRKGFILMSENFDVLMNN